MMQSSRCEIVPVARVNSRGRVLIVDDEPLIRWSLAAALRAAGFDPVAASSGAEAMTLAAVRPAPAAVLIDLELYDTDCRLLVEQITAFAPGCRVLALTTSGPDVARQSPWFTVPFIRKPFDLGDVVRLIEREIA
jgi:two-component system KDP operon response regulator KdpE